MGRDIKNGRTIVGFHFLIRPKQQTAMDVSGDIPESLKQLITNGVTKDKAEALFNKYGEAYISEKLEYVSAQFKQGKVKQLAAYTLKAIEENYQSSTPAKITKPIDPPEDKSYLDERKKTDAYLQSLSEEQRVELWGQFLQDRSDSYALKSVPANQYQQSPQVQTEFKVYVRQQGLVK